MRRRSDTQGLFWCGLNRKVARNLQVVTSEACTVYNQVIKCLWLVLRRLVVLLDKILSTTVS